VVTAVSRLGKRDDESTAVAWIPIDRLPDLDSLAFDHGETVRLYLEFRGQPPTAPTVG
jgi:hypothetical protein